MKLIAASYKPKAQQKQKRKKPKQKRKKSKTKKAKTKKITIFATKSAVYGVLGDVSAG